MIRRYNYLFMALALVALVLAPAAQAAVDTPSISVGQSGHGKQTVVVTAGASGLPDGFTIWWMDESTFASYGWTWPSNEVSQQGAADFTGAPTLNTFGGQYTTFKLAPNASIMIEVGDLFQETGVSGTTSELAYGTKYHFTAFAVDGTGAAASGLSNTVNATTTQSVNCTYTQGYWKTHEVAFFPAQKPVGIGLERDCLRRHAQTVRRPACIVKNAPRATCAASSPATLPSSCFINGDRSALSTEQQLGLRIFRGKGNCMNPFLDSDIRPVRFSLEEKRALVAFLQSLTGRLNEGARYAPRH
jgi:hypothetical protein